MAYSISQLINENFLAGVCPDCAYDAAGRLVKEGDRSFSYGWMDKVLSVTDGDGVRTYSYGLDGQLASATAADGAVSEFLWDGLALIRRDGVDYLNEPHPNGGSPVLASDGRAFFNDILGTSQGVLNDGGYKASSLTAFGDGADGVFFTGKPKVDDALGYAFLFRNYRSDHGKWLTADPMGYPDGWNNFAYCNNHIFAFDANGLSQNFIDYLGMGITLVLDPELYDLAILSAQVNAMNEDVSRGEWHYAGFLHWLAAGGEPITLPWNCFDSGSAYQCILNTVADNLNYVSMAMNFEVGQSATIDIAPFQYEGELISHNVWISLYTMSLDRGTATITRTSETSGTVTINAYLSCHDKGDFNPGETFGPGDIMHDSWFLPLKIMGACDYDQYAYSYQSKTIDFPILE